MGDRYIESLLDDWHDQVQHEGLADLNLIARLNEAGIIIEDLED